MRHLPIDGPCSGPVCSSAAFVLEFGSFMSPARALIISVYAKYEREGPVASIGNLLAFSIFIMLPEPQLQYNLGENARSPHELFRKVN